MLNGFVLLFRSILPVFELAAQLILHLLVLPQYQYQRHCPLFALKSCYRYLFCLIVVRDPKLGPSCLAPLMLKKRGRPKTTSIPEQHTHHKRREGLQICGGDKMATIYVRYIDAGSVQWCINKVNMLSLRALTAQFPAVRFNRMIYISSLTIE